MGTGTWSGRLGVAKLEYGNKRHVPVAILVFKAALSSLFALLSRSCRASAPVTGCSTALATQVVLLMYVQVFASAIRLRYTEPGTNRPAGFRAARDGRGPSAGSA